MQQIVTLLLIGLAAGLMSGMLGIGGGIIIVPLLVAFLGFSQQAPQGTSLGLLLPPLGILAVLNYYKAGFVDLKAVLIMSITFVLGSYLSSKFVVNIPETLVKKIFAVFLLFYSAKLFFGK